MKKHDSWPAGLTLAWMLFLPLACNGSSGSGSGNGNDPEPAFQCQYSLVKDERELLRQGRDKAAAGENLESLLKHADKCLSDTPGS